MWLNAKTGSKGNAWRCHSKPYLFKHLPFTMLTNQCGKMAHFVREYFRSPQKFERSSWFHLTPRAKDPTPPLSRPSNNPIQLQIYLCYFMLACPRRSPFVIKLVRLGAVSCFVFDGYSAALLCREGINRCPPVLERTACPCRAHVAHSVISEFMRLAW